MDRIDETTGNKDILDVFDAETASMTKSERTRLRIIASAARVFSEKGFHETSIQDIADDAGIAKGTIYYYVNKKEDLIISLLEFAQNRLFSKVEKGVSKHSTAIDRVEFMLNAHLSIIRIVFPIFPMFAQSILSADSIIAERLTLLRERYLSTLGSIIKDGMESGELKKGDEREVAYAIFSLVLGQILQQRVFNKKINSKNIIQTTLDVAVRSIKNDPSC